MDTFEMIAAERRGIADMLLGFTAEQWMTQSLCWAWKVRDVAAHLLMPLVIPGPKFGLALLRCGMDFDKANIRLTADVAKRDDAELISGLRDQAENRFKPPGMGPAAPLTDCLVHGQDMRRPLGIASAIDPARQVIVLDFVSSGKARGFVPGTRLAGLRFQATDLDWAAGEGEPVVGPAEALMMAITGRAPALEDLEPGPGVNVLRTRMPAPRST